MNLSPATWTEKVVFFRSLRYPNFRLYWLGMLATTFGHQMRQVVWTLGLLGSLRAGAVAASFGVPVAIAIGGAVVTGFSMFLLAAVHRLRRLQV